MLAIVILLTSALPLFAQNTSGSITGAVQDSSGAVIPGVRIVLINQDQGIEARQTITNEAGLYVFSALPGATYTVTAELPGFKAYKKTDIRMFVNDRLGLPPIVLEVGAVTDTINVEAEAIQLETVSAERSGVITGRQMVDIALNGRNFTALLKTVPGAPADAGTGSASFNGGRANQNNFTVDGQTVTDSGVNQMFAYRISMDAISEFKVSTNSQGAEFGRNSGAQIQVATRSGGQAYHGGGYFFKRHEGWNANTFVNNRAGSPRQIYRFMQTGYNLGGPVWTPGEFNTNGDKLFFFLSHEWGRSRVPNAPRRIVVPTELERNGDFSQSRDGSGIPVYIKDPLKTGACTAADRTACFTNNVVPRERFSPYGQSILSWLPKPNVTGQLGYNYESQAANEDPSFDEVYRVDYNINSNWKSYVRILRSHQTQNRPYGRADSANNLGLTPNYAPTFGWSVNGNVTTIINSSMTNEFQFGKAKNGIPGDAPPAGSPYYRSVSKIDVPLLYPTADPTGLVPNFNFGGTAGAGIPTAMTSFAGLPYANANPIYNVTDNLTWISGSHTIKMGFFLEHAVKTENPFRPFNGTIAFDRDVANPGDTGWAFSNALLGNFTRYDQFSKTVLVNAPYWNVEWFGQDTWKVNSKLTFNYGLRVNHVPPLFERTDAFTNFDPTKYDPAKRVALYQPALDSSGRTVARNPITGETGPAVLIGAIVPGSGNPANGIVRAGQNGVPRGLMENRGPHWGPRVGVAYTVTPKTVIRAGGGIFFERIATSAIGYTTNFLTNPPDVQLSQIYYGNLSSVSSSAGTLFPLQVVRLSEDGKVPTVYNFNLGFQRELPMNILLDVAYVGSQSRHLTEFAPFNALPFGSAWLPETQNPTVTPRFDGTTNLQANLYRPYAGFGGGQAAAGQSVAGQYNFGGTSNYNALQVSVNKRAGRLQLGANYTWSRALGTTGGHLTNTRGVNYGLLGLDRSHGLTFNYIYDVPSLARKVAALDRPVLRQIFDGWQVSGLSSYSVGSPETPSYTLSGIGNAERNRRITGSEDFAPRVVLTCNPNKPRGERTIDSYINTNCFAPAVRGSIGNDSGVNTLRGPGLQNWDVSVFKKFQYGEDRNRYIQLRLQAYNVFNHTNWGTLNSAATFNPTTGALTNVANTTNNRTGFGALTGVRGNGALGGPRIIELAAKLYF
jgi:hypothetical protein